MGSANTVLEIIFGSAIIIAIVVMMIIFFAFSGRRSDKIEEELEQTKEKLKKARENTEQAVRKAIVKHDKEVKERREQEREEEEKHRQQGAIPTREMLSNTIYQVHAHDNISNEESYIYITQNALEDLKRQIEVYGSNGDFSFTRICHEDINFGDWSEGIDFNGTSKWYKEYPIHLYNYHIDRIVTIYDSKTKKIIWSKRRRVF